EATSPLRPRQRERGESHPRGETARVDAGAGGEDEEERGREAPHDPPRTPLAREEDHSDERTWKSGHRHAPAVAERAGEQVRRVPDREPGEEKRDAHRPARE